MRRRRDAPEPACLCLPASDAPPKRRVCAPDPRRRWRAGRIRRPRRRTTEIADLLSSYSRRDRAALRAPACSSRLRRILASPSFVFRPEASRRRSRPGAAYRITDYRAGVAALLLLVEHASPTSAAARRARGPARQPAVLARAGAPHAGRPAVAAFVDNFAGQWLHLRNLQRHRAELGSVPRLRRQPAAGVPARDRAVLRERPPRGPQRPRPDDRPTTRSSTNGSRGTTASPACSAASSGACADRRRAPRAARARAPFCW